MANIAPISPGEILSEEYIKPHGLTQRAVAEAIGVEPMRISRIVNGSQAITADTALRLARLFGTSELFWLKLQDRYDIELRRDQLGNQLDAIRPLGA